MIKAIIIDFDDTLVQTSRFRRDLLEKTLENWTGLSNDEIILDWGQPFRQMVETFIGIDNFESFVKHYKGIMQQNPTELCVGAEHFLEKLNQQHIPVIILSSAILELIESDLKALGILDMIVQIFDSEVVDSPKPSPCAFKLPIEWLQKNYNIDSSQCVYVGDSLTDMECSRCHMDFFAVLSGSTSHQDFINSGLSENKIAENLDELYSILFEK